MTRRKTDAPSANTGGAEAFATETILHNVRILAIDQTIEDKNGEKVVVGQTATMELTPQQVEILTVAQQMSDRLTLSLRSIMDGQPTAADAEADAVHLLGGTKQNGAVTVVKNGVARQETGLR
jgi:pilus assembly protein CpaB